MCSLSLSLCSCVVVVCFHFSPTKVGVRYKNKNSLPSSLSLVLDESIRSSSAQIPTCYNCVIKGLHEYFIRVETCFFVIIAARCLFFVHTREREREKKKEREERAKTTPTKILYLQNTRNVEKKQVVATAFLPRLERERERERDRLRNTLHNHAVFCHTSTFTYFAFLLIIIAY